MSRTYFQIIEQQVTEANQVIEINEKSEVDVTETIPVSGKPNSLINGE